MSSLACWPVPMLARAVLVPPTGKQARGERGSAGGRQPRPLGVLGLPEVDTPILLCRVCEVPADGVFRSEGAERRASSQPSVPVLSCGTPAPSHLQLSIPSMGGTGSAPLNVGRVHLDRLQAGTVQDGADQESSSVGGHVSPCARACMPFCVRVCPSAYVPCVHVCPCV